MRDALGRRPSGGTVVAVIALVVATSGTAVAATKLVSGDKLIKKGTLSGNRLRAHTITGTQLNLSKLGKVLTASNADHATNADHAANADLAANAAHATNADRATNANHANDATTLNGQPVSSFLSSGSRIGTPGIVKASGAASGNTVMLFTVGPFTVTMTCTKETSGNVKEVVSASSSQANSDVDGEVLPANTSRELLTVGPGTAFQTSNNVNIDFEAPSGAQGVLPGAIGINSLGTDCWSNWSGVG